MPRSRAVDRLVVLALLAAALAAALAAGALAPSGDDGLARHDLEAARPRPFLATGAYGVNVDLLGSPGGSAASMALDRHLAAIRASGFGWVRQRVAWAAIEPVPGTDDWRALDAFVAAAERYDLKPLLVLVAAPAWSHPGDPGEGAPPDDPAPFAAFAGRLAARYGGRLGGVEVWDEPNIAPNWGSRAIDPAGYAHLLRAAGAAVRAAAPGLPVVMAGLAPNAESGGRNLSDLAFLDGLYAAGAMGSFDAVAAKPYGLWYDAEERDTDGETLSFARVARLREVMLRHGDAATPIWAVEFGWYAPQATVGADRTPDGTAVSRAEATAAADTTVPPATAGPDPSAGPEPAAGASGGGQPNPWGAVSEAEQADQTRRAIALARRDWPWLTLLCLERWAPPADPADPRAGFALLRASAPGELGSPPGTPTARPVLEAVRAAIADPTLGVGVHPLPRPVDLQQGAPAAPASGSTLGGRHQVAFDGDGVALVLNTEAPVRLRWSVDGRPRGATGLDPCAGCHLTLAAGLAAGRHTLDLWIEPAAVAGDAQVIVVRRSPGPRLAGAEPWREPVRLGLLALAAAFGVAAAVRFGRRLGPELGVAAEGWLRRALGADAAGAAGWVWPLALAALAMAWYHLPGPLALAALGGLGLVAALRPAALLPVIVGFAPLFFHPRSIEPFALAPAPAEALLLALVVAVALNAVLARRFGLPAAFRLPPGSGWSPLDLAPLGFIALGALTLAAAVQPREALRELRTVIVEPALFYYLCLGLLRTRARLLWLPLAVVAAAVALGLWGIGQYIVTGSDIEAEGVRRMRSLYPSPVNFGLLLGRAVPLTAALALLAFPSVAGSRVGGQVAGRAALWAACALLGACLVLSFSLGAWFGAAAGLLVVAATLGRRGLLVAAATAGLLLVLLAALAGVPRVANLLTLAGESTAQLRLLLWQSSLAMLRDHLLLGVGLDNFLYQYQFGGPDGRGYILEGASRDPRLSHPHNLVLDFWLRLGILGVPLLTATLVGFGRRVRAALAPPRADAPDGAAPLDPLSRAVVIGVAAMMVDTVVHGLIDNSYFLPDLATLFWLGVAYVRLVAVAEPLPLPDASAQPAHHPVACPNGQPVARPRSGAPTPRAIYDLDEPVSARG